MATDEMGRQEDYVEECISSTVQEKRKRQRKICLFFSIVGFLVVIIGLHIIKDESLFFVIIGVTFFLLVMPFKWIGYQNMQDEMRLYKEGRRYPGEVIEWKSLGKSGNYPVFRFHTDAGWHKIAGPGGMGKWVQKRYESEHHEVWYDPKIMDGIGVRNAEERNAKVVGYYVELGFLILVGVGLLAWGIYGKLNAFRDEGSELMISFEKKYEASDFTEEEVQSDTIDWINTCYAIYTYANGKNLDTIGGRYEWNDLQVEKIKTVLDEGWDITGHESTVDTVHWLLVEGGQRKRYAKMITQMEKKGWLALEENEFITAMEANVEKTEKDSDDRIETENQYRAAYTAYHDEAGNGIDAWDYCRVLQILGDSYQCGYISLEECLDQSLVVAQYLQQEYDSWEALCNSYLHGYMFWAKNSGSYYSRAIFYEELKDSEDNPYTLDFETELQSSWD